MTVEHDDEVSTRQCPACHESVPAARFCGNCGADRDAAVTRWSVLLRPRVYATAHREGILVPRVSSSYLPRLPGLMRRPFRVGLIAVLVIMLGWAFVTASGPAGVTATLGWPLIFVIYVWQSDVFRDLPARVMVAAMVLGIVSGVAWWLVAGKVLASSNDVTTGEGMLLAQVLNVGFLISLGGSVLLLLPAIVTRFMPVPTREAVDGFVVGTFGALWYQTAATTTVIGPQIAEGLLREQSSTRMIQDALAYGVVNPITTTAAGGLLGLLLWFTPRPGANGKQARTTLILCAVAGIGLYLGVWGIESFALSPAADLMIKLALTVLALLVVRCGIQVALLHEAPDPATGTPIVCAHCARVVPDLPFCSACGVAARASSRSSRRLRHEHPPVPEPS